MHSPPVVVTSALLQQRQTTSSKRNGFRILTSNRLLCSLAVLLFLPKIAALADAEQFNYFEAPKLEWMVQLGDEIRLEQGNAIVASPYDKNKLYITTHTGKLLVRSAMDGVSLLSYDPPPPTQDWRARCESAVTFGEADGIGQYAVYTVVYDPPPGASAGIQSRR
jgi:hypothetical protein